MSSSTPPSNEATLEPASIASLNTISITSWDLNASFWDAFMGHDGNDFFRILELPGLERLAAVEEGDHVLDLATGNGLAARRLAELGGIVTATDASRGMLDFAKQRTENDDNLNCKITYGLLDVTNDQDLKDMVEKAKKHSGFDVVTMNMGIMDVPTLTPLASMLPKVLKKNGRFVATVCHPVFFSPGATRHMELGENQATGRFEAKHCVNVWRYLNIPPAKGEALHGQPAPQLYFHRSMTELFRPFFEAGLKLDGLEESSFTSGPDKTKIQSYYNFPQIPPILIFRMVRSS